MRVGEVAVEREVVDGFVWSAKPVRVAASGDIVALYRAVGTECFWPSHPRGESRSPSMVTQWAAPWGEGRFSGLLTLVRPDDDVSVSLMWDPDWSLICWYVDFIEPYVPTPIGWDFRDLHLDLIVQPDGSSHLKDEDELALAVDRREVPSEVATKGHARLGQVASDAADRIGVFGDDWVAWRPDPSWTVPRLSPAATTSLSSSPTLASERLDLRWWVRS